MKHKVKKTTHHVEAKKECACGENCKCGCNCGCKCSAGKAVILAGTALALIMSGLALWKVNSGCEEKFKEFVEANPVVIIESVNKHYEQMEKERQKPVNVDKIVAEIVADKTNYSLGNPKGKFVIIEFFDHQCGWCKKTNVEMSKVVASAEGKNIRWIPVDTPIFGEASETIARFVLAAGKQGKYAQMHEAVTNAKGKLDEAALIELGKGLGLDTKKLKADADGKAIREKLTANKEYAKKLNINGVPMLIVDGQINPGALLGDKLQEAVKASQAKK